MKKFANTEVRISILAIILWVILVSSFFGFHYFNYKKSILELAQIEANAVFEKDLAYRFWVASVDGVYVYDTKVKPNPYLSICKERDITTITGKRLTLVNPDYMMHLVYKISNTWNQVLAHNTSLRPLNPANQPDPWEKSALLAFEKGKKKVVSVSLINGKRYLRLMKPLVAQKPCLHCHRQFGYKVGDIIGGTSISVPIAPFEKIVKSQHRGHIIVFAVVLVLGISIIVGSTILFIRNKKNLSESESRLRTLMNAMPDIVCFKDGDGKWLGANRYALEVFGLTGVDYRNKKDSDLAEYSQFHREEFLTCEETDELAWSRGKPTRTTEIIRQPDDRDLIFDIIKVPIFDEKGNRKGLLVVGRDVTDLRMAEKELEKVQEMKDLILQLAIDFINIPLDSIETKISQSLELVGHFLKVDRAYLYRYDFHNQYCKLLGKWQRRKVPAYATIPENIPLQLISLLAKSHIKGEVVQFSSVGDMEPGDFKTFLHKQHVSSIITLPIMNDQEECIGFVGLDSIKEQRQWTENYTIVLKILAEIYANVLIRKEIQKRLETGEKKYQELVEGLPIGLYQNTPGPEGRFIMVNKALADMFGYTQPEEMLSISVASLYPDAKMRQVFSQHLINAGLVKDYEMQLKKKDGTRIWVSITARTIQDNFGNTLYFEGSIQDITARKEAEQEKERLQAQLQQAQKLECIGKLAGGLAHDLNNLLVPILGYAELLLTMLEKDHQIRRHVEHITQAGERAKNIVKQLLAFSRKQIIQTAPVDLNKIVKEFEKLLRSTLREDIHIHLKLTPDLPSVLADRGQIEQVILNLAVNAQDAMPDGGDFVIETSLTYLDEEYTKRHPHVKPGSYVLMSVSDTGCGMDKETQKQIFEPFFTTKPKDKGTGLGLATVYGIIRQHNGHIQVYSEPGQGTTFKIYLPTTTEKEQDNPERDTLIKDLSGTETVLLVEDDKEVREFVHTVLERHGFTVLSTNRPDEALKLSREYKGPIHILLTDVVMPSMNGRELYDQIQAHRPEIKTIYMSGYAEDIISSKGVLGRGINFISKPFSAMKLLKIIRTVLGSIDTGPSGH